MSAPGLPAVVITCSDSAASGAATDGSGPLAAELLAGLGHAVSAVEVVADEEPAIGAAVRGAVTGGARIVVLTGGTGAGPRDVTPETLRALGMRELPGLGEAIRAASRARVPAADLSRTVGGTLAGAVVLALPGSTGGVRDGLGAVGHLLGHAAAIAYGSGHPGHERGSRADVAARRTDRDAGQTDRDAGPTHPDAGPTDRDVGPTDAAEAASRTSGATSAPGSLQTPPSVSTSVLDEAAVGAEVRRAAAGAVVTFAGVVRDHDHDRHVTALHYEGHPDASRILDEVVAEATSRPGVLAAAARHRVGDLGIGDVAFVAAASAAHRGDAFAACSWLVDEAKARLPIWKHQHFADGSDEWVNSP